MNNIRWIFFDQGGTLIDESKQEENFVQTIRDEFLKFDLDYSLDQIFKIMKEASVHYKSPHSQVIRGLSKNGEQFDAVSGKARYLMELGYLFQKVDVTLKLLSDHYKLGVIANGSAETLRHHNILDYFSAFAYSADLGFGKPDPRIFQHALTQADCDPKNAIYVGDRLDNDIYPAKKIGFTTVRVLQGIGALQVPIGPEYEPTFTIDRIADIVQLFCVDFH